MAFNTGMRLSEILGLRWSRIDFSKGTITVDSQLAILREKGGKRVLAPTKNEETRTFKVAKFVLDILKNVKKKQAQNRLAAGSAWQYEIDDLVFTDEIGRTTPHASVEHHFHKIVEAIGCPEHRVHDCRHTFATIVLRFGNASIKTLSKALGHKSVAFTLDIYGHVSDEMVDDFADLMERIIAR